MSVVQRVLKRATSQFPERLLKRVLRESSVLGGLAGQLPQGFENGIHLDFKNNFHYIKVPGQDPSILPFTSLFTFTGDNKSMYRGSAGLLIPSATNTPRIEYDANGNCLGLLIEGARTNLALQSADFSTSWSVTRILAFGSGSVVNATTAPDGAATADNLVEDTSTTNVHQITQSYTKAASALAYSFSVFAKAKERTHLRLVLGGSAADTNNVSATFNLSAGSISTAAAAAGSFTSASASISAYANGWYRITLSGTSNTDTALRTRLDMCDGSGDSTYSGDGASGLYVWGAQLEQAAFPSSYIPTTTGSVARARDLISSTFGAEIDVTKGTVYSESSVYVLDSAQIQPIWRMGDATNGFWTQHYIPFGTDKTRVANFTASAAVADLQLNLPVVGVFTKLAAAYATNDFAACQDGGAAVVDTSGTLGAPTTVNIGSGTNTASNLWGHIRRLDYWPERKPNSELQRLTS